MEIGQVSSVYLHDINQYQKILHQRNAYLKQIQMRKQTDDAMLSVLNEQFIHYATRILQKRFEFLKLLDFII